MNEPSFENRMSPLYDKAFNILVERQKKYGPNNILLAGEWGVMEQIQNKVARARAQLHGEIRSGQVQLGTMSADTMEVYRDSLLDLANYALILIALAEGRWTAEMVVSGSQIQEGDR
jgi:predicted Rossmann-fold nucleotide-binding protein